MTLTFIKYFPRSYFEIKRDLNLELIPTVIWKLPLSLFERYPDSNWRLPQRSPFQLVSIFQPYLNIYSRVYGASLFILVTRHDVTRQKHSKLECHQHIWSPITVINIDITLIWNWPWPKLKLIYTIWKNFCDFKNDKFFRFRWTYWVLW